MAMETANFAGVLDEYKTKGLASRVGAGRRPAVLVVDLTIGFTDPGSPLGADYTLVLKAVDSILGAARDRAVPVYFTRVAYSEPDARDGGLFVEKVPSLKLLSEGSRLAELDARLKRRPSETVLTKKYASGFFGTPLHELLQSAGVDTLIVTGCTTSGCIRATVVDALQLGYRAMVPREAVGDRSPLAHTANLTEIDGKYGDVVSVATVVEYLETLEY
jgi:maleamate amidohydrolase